MAKGFSKAAKSAKNRAAHRNIPKHVTKASIKNAQKIMDNATGRGKKSK